MGFLSRTFIKKELNTSLKSFVKKCGYTLQSYRGDLMIVKEQANKLFTIPVYISTYDDLILSQASIGYLAVEDILFKVIGLPFEYKEYPNIPTINIIANDYGKRLSGKLKEEEDFDEIVGNFMEAFTDYYLPTFEKYSDPKNVLELWDSLPTMRSKADNYPSPDNYSKIIILSKMCNDENYQKRVDETISFFQSEIDKGEDWMQNKLDVFLKVIEYLEKNEL